jgi:hypothetical protein
MSRLLAPFLAIHGAVHIGYICGPAWPFAATDPWLVTLVGVNPNTVRAIGIALALVAFAGYLLAAVTAAGFAPPLWPVFLPAAAGASAIMLILFVTPWTLPGLAIDTVLLVATLVRGWRPTTSSARSRRVSRRPANRRRDESDRQLSRGTVDPAHRLQTAGRPFGGQRPLDRL